MPSKPMRPCKKIGCKNITSDGYCKEHQHIKEQEVVERNKYYDLRKRDRKSKEFYNSPEWLTTRKVVLVRDNGLCQHCLKEGKVTFADMVHHIVPVKKDWNKRLDLANLISLCNGCHSAIDHKG